LAGEMNGGGGGVTYGQKVINAACAGMVVRCEDLEPLKRQSTDDAQGYAGESVCRVVCVMFARRDEASGRNGSESLQDRRIVGLVATSD